MSKNDLPFRITEVFFISVWKDTMFSSDYEIFQTTGWLLFLVPFQSCEGQITKVRILLGKVVKGKVVRHEHEGKITRALWFIISSFFIKIFLFYSKFEPNWTILNQFGQIWKNLDNFDMKLLIGHMHSTPRFLKLCILNLNLPTFLQIQIVPPSSLWMSSKMICINKRWSKVPRFTSELAILWKCCVEKQETQNLNAMQNHTQTASLLIFLIWELDKNLKLSHVWQGSMQDYSF